MTRNEQSPEASLSGEETQHDVHCPLCDYNLHGLDQPRCPECGYTCDWQDLLDPKRRRHPYVFEHHPERNLRSFWQTALGGLRPGRFWLTLHPAQPAAPRRLLIYWILATGLFLLGLGAGQMWLSLGDAQSRLSTPADRARIIANLNHPSKFQITQGLVQEYGSIQTYLDTFFPLELSIRFVMKRFVLHERFMMHSMLFLFVVAWPWLTLVALLIFRISMRKARIRTQHVLRCIVYSFDAFLWIGLVLLLTVLTAALTANETWFGAMRVLSPQRIESVLIRDTAWIRSWSELGMIALCALVLAVPIVRLGTAYSRYLRFDHPMATVLVSQFIVFLLLANVIALTAVLT